MCGFSLRNFIRIFGEIDLASGNLSFSFHDLLYFNFRSNWMVLHCRNSLNKLNWYRNILPLGNYLNHLNHSALHAYLWTDWRKMDFHIFRNSNINWYCIFCFSNERDLRKIDLWAKMTVFNEIKYVSFITFKWRKRRQLIYIYRLNMFSK